MEMIIKLYCELLVLEIQINASIDYLKDAYERIFQNKPDSTIYPF